MWIILKMRRRVVSDNCLRRNDFSSLVTGILYTQPDLLMVVSQPLRQWPKKQLMKRLLM